MQILSIKRSFLILAFMFTGLLAAQDRPLGSETVIVVKPYTPSVNDAFKIKETPRLGDSVTLEKKPVKYSIFSVPVASTFSPVKGQATRVERAQRVKLFDNYATLGFGSYSSVLAEFYTNLEVNRSDNFGIFLTHNSSQGGIEQVNLDDSFYNTELNLNYNSKNKNNSWKTDLGFKHQLFNWYGVPVNPGYNELPGTWGAIDPQQNYFSVNAGAEIDMYDSFFESARGNYRFFGDAFGSNEHHFKTDALFELNIADELISTQISGDIVNGRFDRNFNTPSSGIDYTFVNVGITPSLLILRDDLTVNLGVSFFYSLNAQNSQNSFYFYPRVTASYRLVDDLFIPYAGLEGNLNQNTYHDFVQENPFVSPTLTIMPTDTPYDAFVGVKGKLGNSIAYNLRGSYMAEHNRAMFLKNPFLAGSTAGYTYANSFNIVYDDVNTLSLFGEINVDVNRNFKLRMNGTIYNYSTNFEAQPWNLPDYRASLLADYQITEKWFAGANLYFLGERRDREPDPLFDGNSMRTISLDGFMDLNANLGYRFNNQLSIFARGHNLLNNNYQRWAHFPVQGLQVLAGATYKFDY